MKKISWIPGSKLSVLLDQVDATGLALPWAVSTNGVLTILDSDNNVEVTINSTLSTNRLTFEKDANNPDLSVLLAGQVYFVRIYIDVGGFAADRFYLPDMQLITSYKNPTITNTHTLLVDSIIINLTQDASSLATIPNPARWFLADYAFEGKDAPFWGVDVSALLTHVRSFISVNGGSVYIRLGLDATGNPLQLPSGETIVDLILEDIYVITADGRTPESSQLAALLFGQNLELGSMVTPLDLGLINFDLQLV